MKLSFIIFKPLEYFIPTAEVRSEIRNYPIIRLRLGKKALDSLDGLILHLLWTSFLITITMVGIILTQNGIILNIL